jgi:UDP-2,4-diacetamido-2,4,6-trideoxy-beta-L-altropyranose hydrolase
MKQRIQFRVDANQTIGYGHLVRCMAISEVLSAYNIEFYSTENISAFLSEQSKISPTFLRLKTSDAFFDNVSSDSIVVLDGYQFNSAYQRAIKETGANLVLIDDLAMQEVHADVIINPNPLIKARDYSSPPSTLYCIGFDFALLRSPFLDLIRNEREPKEKNSLLICFGGSDPLNKTKTALITVLNSTTKFQTIHVVLGPGYQHHEAIMEICADTDRVQVHNALGGEEMADLMSKTAFAILPCSSILLEGLCAQMKILSGYYIDNQKYVYEGYLDRGWFVDAKSFQELEIQAALLELKEKAIIEDVIDGRSMTRIAKAINLLTLERSCTLRKATIDDVQTTFDWANTPATRQFSINKDPIPWDNHRAWFTAKLTDSNCWYGILEQDGKPVGSIRFDITDATALISYLVYGKGFGTLLMKLGMEGLLQQIKSIHEIHGFVFEENIASMKTFERFGFDQTSSDGMPLFIKKIESYV